MCVKNWNYTKISFKAFHIRDLIKYHDKMGTFINHTSWYSPSGVRRRKMKLCLALRVSGWIGKCPMILDSISAQELLLQSAVAVWAGLVFPEVVEGTAALEEGHPGFSPRSGDFIVLKGSVEQATRKDSIIVKAGRRMHLWWDKKICMPMPHYGVHYLYKALDANNQLHSPVI